MVRLANLRQAAARAGLLDLSFIKLLDPALKESKADERPAHVVVHALQRAQPLFRLDDSDQLPLADPTEVLLDLGELRLNRQADELIENLRDAAR